MKKPHVNLEERIDLAEKMRRVFAVHLLRWARQARLARIDRDRRDQALMFNKYELVGGRRDGEVVICYGLGLCPEYCYAGVYHLKGDGRLHYHARELPPLDLE
jgi:hypothetical protein